MNVVVLNDFGDFKNRNRKTNFLRDGAEAVQWRVVWVLLEDWWIFMLLELIEH